MYSSALEISKKFNISTRRVQMLCKQGRLHGAKQISGVWLIPSNVEKPKDERYSKSKYIQLSIFGNDSKKNFTLKELCEELSISYATGKNWIKLKKISPDIENKYYSNSYINNLKGNIDRSTNILKSRRNKLQKKNNSLYKTYIDSIYNQELLESITSKKRSFSKNEIKIFLANTALQMYYKTKHIQTRNWNILFSKYSTKISKTFKCILDDLLYSINLNKVSNQLKKLLEYDFEYNQTDDLLGFIYISLTMLNQRKKIGLYYTPKKLVNTLKTSLTVNNLKDINICDPCCGSGNFLISFANDKIKCDFLYGEDIDHVNILLTRLNMALLYPQASYNFLCEHFVCANTLLKSFSTQFDLIIGNPPWGGKMDKQDYYMYQKLYLSANQTNVDSFSLFIEKSLSMLKENGVLSFILPESILNIDVHHGIREIISKKCSVEYVNFLGNAFYGVQCPSIILSLKLDYKSQMKNCLVINKNNSYIISDNRKLNAEGFLFNISDQDNILIDLISHSNNIVYLKNNADFALGIVTGDNKRYVINKKGPNCEIILKGKNISRYKIEQSFNYIEFKPEEFQQVASTEIYRAKEKLFYRFISKKPIFCYDNHQLLSLNSCNILIPKIKGLKIKYVLAILNSSVATFYISKKYNSIKMLKSYIEQLPIPIATEQEQKEIIELVNKIMISKDHAETDKIYNDIDNLIFSLYSINEQQKDYIKQSI